MNELIVAVVTFLISGAVCIPLGVLIRKKTDIRNIQYKDVIKDMENIFKKAKIVKREEEI